MQWLLSSCLWINFEPWHMNPSKWLLSSCLWINFEPWHMNPSINQTNPKQLFIVCTLASFPLRSSSSASSSSLARAGGGNWRALADLRFSHPGTGLRAVCFAEKEEEELDVVAEVVAACWQKKNRGSLQVYSAKIYRVFTFRLKN